MTAPNAARAYWPPSQAQRWPPALSCPSALWPTWRPSWALDVSIYLKAQDDRLAVSKAIDVLYGKELQCLGAVDDRVFEDSDYVLRKMTGWCEWYPPKKGKKGDGDEESREDEDDAGDGKDCGVEYEDVAQLQPSDWE